MDVVLNWLWQGGVVGLAAAAVLGLVPRSHTQARYCFVWAGCVLVLALPAVPHFWAATFSLPSADDSAVSLGPVVSMPVAWWTSTALALGLWITWSGAYAVRLLVAAVALRETRRRCRACPSDTQARLHCWSRVRATGRQSRVVLSTGVRSAAVLGCGSPIIAVAPALVEQLSDADLDRVVIHEWAHVQRRDDIAQLAQRLVCLVAGWHPAVWWLQRQLELEREVACDELAIVMTGSAKGYAACLATLAALPMAPVRSLPALAVSSSGLRLRLGRILVAQQVVPARRWRAIAVCASAVLTVFASAVGNVHLVEAAATSLSLAVQPVIARTIATRAPATSRPLARAASAVSAAPESRFPRGESTRPAKGANRRARDMASAGPTVEPPTSALTAVPLRSSDWPLAIRTSTAAAPVTPEVPSAPLTGTHAAAHASDTLPRTGEKARTPWAAAADAGVAIGRGSQNAGVATAGFFSRFGKKMAGSF